MDFPDKYQSERNVEIPLLLDFVKSRPDIKRALDVGCSHALYAKELSEAVPHLDGIDLVLDHDVNQYFKKFFVGDVLNLKLKLYDLVSCVSTLEHYGVKHETGDDYEAKQEALVKRLGSLAKKYVYITIPYGQPQHVLGTHSITGNKTLAKFRKALVGFKTTVEFYSKAFPENQGQWVQVPQKKADSVVYTPGGYVTCLCIIKAVKKAK